jgi:hypothetical protein
VDEAALTPIARARACTIASTIAGTPTPCTTCANTTGPSPRIFAASRAITSRLAPTCGARSVLLITSRSDCVIPGPPLRGTLSPPATSIT